jgi:hypothetical protein
LRGDVEGELDWCRDAAAEMPAQDGSVVTADYNHIARSRQDFFEGLISEIRFPACDRASKDAAYATLKISPE